MFGVFIHRADSIYQDSPAVRYQFPSIYYSRAMACVGGWIIYYEPTKVRNSRGYYALAKVATVVPDPAAPNMFLALIEPDSYLDLPYPVPFKIAGQVVERGVLNEEGRNSGRAQAAIRPISEQDFRKIVELGVGDVASILPRTDKEDDRDVDRNGFHEDQLLFEVERDRIVSLTSRTVRKAAFRRIVLRAYDERCAVTGLKLINGGGRAEVEAAHIRPVEANGPDSISNGVPLSGTVHWMFDRGLISFSDSLDILISRHVNDRAGIEGLLNPTGRLIGPLSQRDRPHPMFLQWHRENCFKH